MRRDAGEATAAREQPDMNTLEVEFDEDELKARIQEFFPATKPAGEDSDLFYMALPPVPETQVELKEPALPTLPPLLPLPVFAVKTVVNVQKPASTLRKTKTLTNIAASQGMGRSQWIQKGNPKPCVFLTMDVHSAKRRKYRGRPPKSKKPTL